MFRFGVIGLLRGRKKLGWIGAGALVLMAVVAVTAATSLGLLEKRRPNVLLLTVDTLRADHLGVYGYRRNTSPNIDAFARGGVVFKKARCNWPKTTPSFASMHTGTYGRTNGVQGVCRQALPLELTTIAEVMKANGYATAAVVDNANLSKRFQFDQGFDHFVEIWEQPGKDDATKVMDHALGWLRESRQQPFFLWVHLVDPHAKYLPPPDFDKMFLNDELYKTGDRMLEVKNGYGGIHRVRTQLGDHRNLNYYQAQYDGEIAYADSQVARIFDEMKRRDIFDGTLTIFSSDHGEEMGEHGLYFEHGIRVYEATLHVPLIVRYPEKIRGGQEVPDNLTLLRLFPTILDYCGIPPIAQLQGKSLRTLLEGRGERQRAVYTEGGYRNKTTGRYNAVVYEGDWKLIQTSGTAYKLFNLAADPAEQVDLARKNRRVFQRLKKKIRLFDRFQKQPPKAAPPPAPSKKGDDAMSEATRNQLKALGYME